MFFSKQFARYSLVSLSLLFCSCTNKKSEKAALPEGVPAAASAEESTPPQTAPAAPVTEAVATQPVPVVANAAAAAPATENVSRISGTVTVARLGSMSFKVGGHIGATTVRVGDIVKKGQVIAQLEDKDYVIRENIATVAVEQAKVTADQTKKDFSREEQLQKENASTVSSLERASNAKMNADLAARQARLNLETAQKSLADTKLLAAYNGVISKQLKFNGEYVGVGAAVFEIYDSEQIEVSLKVPENLMSRTKVGMDIDLNIPSISKQGKLHITRIVPLISETSRTFEVIGKIQGITEQIVPGQFVEAKL